MNELALEYGVTRACIKAVRSGNNYKEWFSEWNGLSVEEQVLREWVVLKTEI